MAEILKRILIGTGSAAMILSLAACKSSGNKTCTMSGYGAEGKVVIHADKPEDPIQALDISLTIPLSLVGVDPDTVTPEMLDDLKETFFSSETFEGAAGLVDQAKAVIEDGNVKVSGSMQVPESMQSVSSKDAVRQLENSGFTCE